MDATQNQMLVDIHNALPLMGWGYKNTKIPDPYDAHQALRNADTNSAAAVAAVKALAAPVASIGTAVAALTTAVAKLGTEDTAILDDLKAAQAALAGIPAMVESALKDGTVHVDVAVTGPTAPPAPAK